MPDACQACAFRELLKLLSLGLGIPSPGNELPAPTGERRGPLLRHSGLGLRVLVVEDNLTNQAVALGMLRKMGLEADASNNGEEALRALESSSYDLVLMDCQMPVLDGYETTRRLRDPGSKVRDRGVPVIAMTAHAMEGERENCLAAGMDDYLSKPVTIDSVTRILRQVAPCGTRACAGNPFNGFPAPRRRYH